jgi:H+/gluconate symporter-like permease
MPDAPKSVNADQQEPAVETARLEQFTARGPWRIIFKSIAVLSASLVAVALLMYYRFGHHEVFGILYALPLVAIIGAIWGMLEYSSRVKELNQTRAGSFAPQPHTLRENAFLNQCVLVLLMISIQIEKESIKHPDLPALALMLFVSSAVIQIWVAVRAIRFHAHAKKTNSTQCYGANNSGWVQCLFAIFVIIAGGAIFSNYGK